MLFIAHRGNISGSIPMKENRIDYIMEALVDGYDVEVDVIEQNGELFLGHDVVQEPFPPPYIYDPRLWFHAKNAGALQILQTKKSVVPKLKYFWHQTDDYTLVSNGKIWVYPGKKLFGGSIAVLPETDTYSENYGTDWKTCYAVCTDYPSEFKELYESSHIS